MKLSRSQILILVAIWATVLLVPPLNFLLRAQLHGNNMMPFAVVPGTNFAFEISEEDALHFLNNKDVLLQAALSSPEIIEDTVQDDGEPLPAQESHNFAVPRNFRPSSAFPGQPERSDKREKLRRLELLSERYPRDALILSVYLRTAIATYYGRTAEDLTKSSPEEGPPPGSEGPPLSTKPEYSSVDLWRAVELCSRGQKIEPDNAFFDWMKCSFLLLAWRDGEALQALNLAASKSYFKDYIFQELQSQREAFSTVLGRALTVEEKEYLFAFQQWWHFSRYREMAIILATQSTKAQRRGDHTEALRISAGISRIGSKMRGGADLRDAASIAIRIENIAWGAPVYDARQLLWKKKKGFREQNSLKTAAQTLFQNYAMRHGRKDLVSEARQNFAEGEELRQILEVDYTRDSLGIPYSIGSTITLLWGNGVLLLLLLPFTVILLLFTAFTTHLPRVWKVLRLRETTANEIPSSREIWNGSLACGGLRSLFPFLLAWVIYPFIPNITDPEWKRTALFSESYTPAQEFYFSLLPMMWNAPPAQFSYVLMLSPLLFGSLFAAWRATEWQRRVNKETKRRPVILQIMGFIVMILLVTAWLALATVDGGFSWIVCLGFVFLCAGVVLAEKFVIWRKLPHRAATIRYGMRLLQRSLAAWLVLGSALYLILLLISLPLRNQADASAERVLALGEVRALQTNLKAPS